MPSEVITDTVSAWRHVRPRLFDVPGSRLCIETMQAWMEGDEVWPYDKIIEVWGIDFMDWQTQWRRRMGEADPGGWKYSAERTAALHEARHEYIARFGFVIPCKELMDALREAAPIVEVGAGSGYMTRLMRVNGIDVIGSDLEGYKDGSHYGFVVGDHDPQQANGVSAKAMARRHPERAVFCSWPSLHMTWFRQMLRAMRIGQTVIAIAEDACAEDSAWLYLDECFEERNRIELPCFPGMHDHALVCVKRRQDAQAKNRAPMLGRRGSLPRRAAAGNGRRTSKAT
jgi:hypothetical protein